MNGRRLGSWIIERELGRGGMGCVYLARRAEDGEKGEPVAIKILAAELAIDPGFLARFQREIAILRQLDHPNIVQFRDSGQENNHSYFVMEYVAGPSYELLLSQRGRLPWPDVLELAWQIAPALKHAHDRGVIHRDLKPSNLLLTPASEMGASGSAGKTLTESPRAGLVKLTDFGIASLFASPHLTVTGGVVGTAEYLSPEQAAGKPVTRRSDLYSLGVVLYTLLTGRTPFVGTPVDLLHKHRFAQFDRPSRLVPEVPHDLDEIVCELLEKDPAKRPADSMVLFRRLDRFKRKLSYQATHAGMDTGNTEERAPHQSATRPQENVEGPATLMSRLMRRELEREKTGGAVRQFFNRPVVLAVLMALTLGLIAWAFWPLSAETMYQRGAALMNSPEPDDWQTAWDKYLEPLLTKHPDTPHRAEVESFRVKCESARAARQAARGARFAGPMSEAQWFYQEGLRLRQRGEEAEAKRVWRTMVQAFQDVPSEGPWVRLAERELAKSGEKVERHLAPVQAALRHSRELRQRGETKEADALEKALKDLYRGDKQAEALFENKN